MTEIVTDMAPGVTLYVANPLSPLDLRRVMRWMTNRGVEVISHSVNWVYDGPGDGTSPRGDSPLRTINMAVKSGALWVNAVGNEARSTWTGPVVDVDGDHRIEFSGTERNRVEVRRGQPLQIQMRWDDRWGGAVSDLDVFIENSAGRQLASSNDVQVGDPGNNPLEVLTFRGAPGSYSVVVEHFAGLCLHGFRSRRSRGTGSRDSSSTGALGRLPTVLIPVFLQWVRRIGRHRPE